MSETDLSRAIQQALEAIGALVVRVQSGTARGGKQRLAKTGTPDLWVAWRGATMWLEVKLPGEKLSEAQEIWHAKCRAEGGDVRVVQSAHEALYCVQFAAQLLGHKLDRATETAQARAKRRAR